MTAENRLRIPLVKTGIPNLDAVLGGGLPHLSFTILAGAPGAGKTTLAHEIMFHVGTPEAPALHFSILGEPTVKLLRYQQQFDFFDPTRVGRDVLYFDVSDQAESGGIAKVMEFINAEVQRRNPGLVVIDTFRSVQDLALSDGQALGLRHFTHDLARMLASWGVTSILIGEYPVGDTSFNPEFTIADGIIWLNQEAHQNAVTRKLQVVKMRGVAAMPGRHTFRITQEGLHIYPHLSEIKLQSVPAPEGRSAFGVKGLDDMMRGGPPRGQSTLVAGSSGTGKTLLALHFMVEGAKQGEAGVMVTFEEQPQAHIQKAQGFGWDLADLEKRGLLRMIYLRPLDLSVDEVLGEIQQAARATGAKRVVINSISGFELAIAASEKEEFREALYRLVGSLTASGITVLMTTEVPDLFGDVKMTSYGVSFIADNIILLRYVEIESALRKALMVVKMRTSDHDKELRQYRIGRGGIQVEAPFTDYSGVLSGIPTLRALAGPQPYTSGLTPDEESLTYVLMSLREATAEQLAESMNLPENEVKAMLDKLVDTGYIVRHQLNSQSYYRVSMTVPGTTSRRRTRNQT